MPSPRRDPSTARSRGSRAKTRRHTSTASCHARTRRAHAFETAEDYVESIADLLRDHGEARAVDLARLFGVTHVTVNRTIARLQRDGFVVSRPYRAIFLTPKGERLAEKSRRRHEVVIRFLLAIGVREPAARHDAEGIEHHVSDETMRAMEAWVITRTKR
jgi:DtxR family manganese transport transcriptional regulator